MHLGISGYFHDSSVALLSDEGFLIDFKKEEWLSRVKGDKSFPRLAIADVLLRNEIEATDITSVTFYEKPMKAWLSVLKYSIKNNPLKNELTINYFKNIWKSSLIFSYDLRRFFNFKDTQIFYSDHHLSHTLSALYYAELGVTYTSVVVDGFGDFACTSIHHVTSSEEITNKWSSEYPHSVGLFYSAVTDFLGFPINDGEYQVMGLASYGSPRFFDKLSKMIAFQNGDLILNAEYFDFPRSIQNSYSEKFVDELGVKPRLTNKALDLSDEHFQVYADIAASAQALTEHLLAEIFEFAHKLTGCRNFLFSGGVAMNSVALRQLAELEFVDQIIVPPSPGDSGSSLGAAYLGLLKSRKEPISVNVVDDYTKLLYPGKTQQEDDFFELKFKKIANPSASVSKVASLLASGKIIATCYRNIETGPRALGHRSLLCDGHNKKLIAKLNFEIKKRSHFRPTAPVVLEAEAENYFDLLDPIKNCYWHMGAVATPKIPSKKPIDGVIHVDGTCRVQLCNESQLIGQVLKATAKYNIDVLANTSFNISSDPMVFSKEDALLSLERMNLDFILTEHGLFERRI